MKLLAAFGVYLAFALLIGLGILIAITKGSFWLLLAGMAVFLFTFIRYGCLADSQS